MRPAIVFLTLLSLTLFSSTIYAQRGYPQKAPAKTAPKLSLTAPSKDVPQEALWEIQRRGTMVQDLGTVQATEADIIADALTLPPDDSHKWFITVVTMNNCRVCDKLKYDFNTSPVLAAWVNVSEPEKSQCHYQVRRIEDTTQRDWLAGIDGQLRKGGFPAIVIQPPRNGQYGPNSTVVKIIHGYDGNAEKLTRKMRDSIIEYVRALPRQGGTIPVGPNAVRQATVPRPGGFQQAEAGYGQQGLIGVNPPFVTPDRRTDPFQPSGPVSPSDWPNTPTAPQPLTPAQIQAVCGPNCSPEFILKQQMMQASDPNAVRMAWMVEQMNEANRRPFDIPNPEAPNKVNPTDPLSPWSVVGLAIAGTILVLLVAPTVKQYRITRNDTPATTPGAPAIDPTQLRVLMDQISASGRSSSSSRR